MEEEEHQKEKQDRVSWSSLTGMWPRAEWLRSVTPHCTLSEQHRLLKCELILLHAGAAYNDDILELHLIQNIKDAIKQFER